MSAGDAMCCLPLLACSLLFSAYSEKVCEVFQRMTEAQIDRACAQTYVREFDNSHINARHVCV